MKDCNTMQYGYYLVLITFKRDFKGDWVGWEVTRLKGWELRSSERDNSGLLWGYIRHRTNRW